MHRILLLATVAACGIPQDLDRGRYPDLAAEVFCDRLQECARGQFDRAHFGMRDCRVGVATDFELIARAAEDEECAYQGRAASQAVSRLQAMSCKAFYDEEYVEHFDALWDCAGE